MKQTDPKMFYARRQKCSQDIQNVLDLLTTVAKHAGPQVKQPTFGAKGEGVTFWSGKTVFCRLDPKHRENHVGAFIRGAGQDALKSAGTLSKQAGWVFVKDMYGAVRLVPELLRAYDSATRR